LKVGIFESEGSEQNSLLAAPKKDDCDQIELKNPFESGDFGSKRDREEALSPGQDRGDQVGDTNNPLKNQRKGVIMGKKDAEIFIVKVAEVEEDVLSGNTLFVPVKVVDVFEAEGDEPVHEGGEGGVQEKNQGEGLEKDEGIQQPFDGDIVDVVPETEDEEQQSDDQYGVVHGGVEEGQETS
jgi:hypothetical protein